MARSMSISTLPTVLLYDPSKTPRGLARRYALSCLILVGCLSGDARSEDSLHPASGPGLTAGAAPAAPSAPSPPASQRPGQARPLTRPTACSPYVGAVKPTAVSTIRIAKLLNREVPSDAVITPWRYLPSTILVGLEDEHVGDADEIALELFLIRANESDLQLVASTPQPIRSPAKTARHYRHFQLDLAPYRLRDNEYAFALRISYEELAYVGTTHSWEDILAIRVNGSRLESILRTKGYEYSERALREPNHEEQISGSSTCATIQISASKTNGVFDWIEVPSTPDREPVVHRWNGSGFD